MTCEAKPKKDDHFGQGDPPQITYKETTLPENELARIWKHPAIIESATRLFGSMEVAKQEVAKMPIMQWKMAGAKFKTLLPPKDKSPFTTIKNAGPLMFADAQMKNVTSNDVLVEVGGNVGQFTVLWLKAIKVKHVFSVEPSRLAAFYHRWNVIMNRLGQKVTFQEAACVPDSAAEPTIALTQGGWDHTEASQIYTGSEEQVKTADNIYDVPTTSLADLSAMVRKRFGHDTKYLKVNCEGCEVGALGLTDRSVLETFENLHFEGASRDWKPEHPGIENFHKRLCTRDIWRFTLQVNLQEAETKD